MFDLSAMQWMAGAWGLISVVLVVLLMHRLMLGIHEDDELILGPGKEVIEQEQALNTRRIAAVTPYLTGLLVAWGALLVGMVALWIYRGLYS